LADTSTLGLLVTNFKDKQYDEQSIIEFFKQRKYTNIKIGEAAVPSHHNTYTKLIRFNLQLYNKDRTAFIGVDKEGLVKYISFEFKYLMEHPPPPSNAAAIGCLLGIIILVGIIIWGIVAMFSDIADTLNEEEEFNPYTEDFDGDGLKGDQDDLDILHQMPTMPTEPIDGE
jgi:hypothetical protein